MNRRDIFKGFIGAPVVALTVTPKTARLAASVECPECKHILAFSYPDESDNSMLCLNQHCSEYLVKYNRPSVPMERV